MNKIIISLLFICSCAEAQSVVTWGETSEDVAVAYCDKAIECGYVNKQGLDLCIRHTVSHYCYVDDTCDLEIEIDDDYDLVVEQCVNAIYNMSEDDCWATGQGFLPLTCAKVWSYKPDEL